MKLTNPEVRIENSSVCNAHCVICPREKMTRPKVVMPNDHFYKLVDQADKLGAKIISVFGYGEPLIDRLIHDKISYCSDLGLETHVSTNALLLSDVIAVRLLDAGLSHIRFSVHGISSDHYKAIHGLNFSTVLSHIYRFIELNDSKYNHSCKTLVSVIPMHEEDIEDIRNFWNGNVDFLEIWKPHNWINGRRFRPLARKKTTCGRPFRGPVQINADGKMMVCCFDFDAKLTVGDTYKNSIEEILKGGEFERIRQAHSDGDLDGLICETCDQLNEGDSPLLYSNRDELKRVGCTSTIKFNLEA